MRGGINLNDNLNLNLNFGHAGCGGWDPQMAQI